MAYWDNEASLTDSNPIFLYRFFGETLGVFGFTSALMPITLDGVGYQPWPIRHDTVTMSMSPDRKDLKVTMGQGSYLDDLFTSYPPTENLYLSIRRSHSDIPSTLANAPQVWSGRVMGVEYGENSEIEFTCEPMSTSSRRPGLRRNYQLNCPFLLYGTECEADKAAATTVAVATLINRESFTINKTLDPVRYYGGVVEWRNASNQREAYTIRSIVGNTVFIGGKIRSLPNGTSVSLSYGCNHTMEHCLDLHNNILNYGGMPWIPLQNPMENMSSIFY